MRDDRDRVNIDFTEKELNNLAAFVCDRVDSMQECIDDPKVTAEDYKKSCRKVIKELASLDEKLRPYHVKGIH